MANNTIPEFNPVDLQMVHTYESRDQAAQALDIDGDGSIDVGEEASFVESWVAQGASPGLAQEVVSVARGQRGSLLAPPRDAKPIRARTNAFSDIYVPRDGFARNFPMDFERLSHNIRTHFSRAVRSFEKGNRRNAAREIHYAQQYLENAAGINGSRRGSVRGVTRREARDLARQLGQIGHIVQSGGEVSAAELKLLFSRFE